MNDKKAKALRRMARAASVGLPERRYVNQGGTIRLVGCTREAYRRLKRAERLGR